MELVTPAPNHSLDSSLPFPGSCGKVPSAICTKMQNRPPGSTFEKIIVQIHKDADRRMV